MTLSPPYSPPGLTPGPTYEHLMRAGDLVFAAGQIARGDDGTIVGIGDAGEQAKHIYRNIGLILDHLQATPRNVVKINTILVDRADREAVTRERLRFFGDHRPPHTGVIVSGLGDPDVKVEVEIVIYKPV
mgnify:CR=1 FL=1